MRMRELARGKKAAQLGARAQNIGQLSQREADTRPRG
jgi:hypothetical protein